MNKKLQLITFKAVYDETRQQLYAKQKKHQSERDLKHKVFFVEKYMSMIINQWLNDQSCRPLNFLSVGAHTLNCRWVARRFVEFTLTFSAYFSATEDSAWMAAPTLLYLWVIPTFF